MKTLSHNTSLTILVAIAVALFLLVLGFVNWIVGDMGREEEHKMKLWAKATQLVVEESPNNNEMFDLLLQIIQGNTTIPVIMTDDNDNILSVRNLTTDGSILSPNEMRNRLNDIRNTGHCIDIPISDNTSQHLYYAESNTIRRLSYLPLVEIALVTLFGLFAYMVLGQLKRAEQDKVWIGLARETAHQLGTPLTALSAWTELLRSGDIDATTAADEINHDTERLRSIAERFSKIGSEPELNNTSLIDTINNVVTYLETRLPKNITLCTSFDNADKLIIKHNPTLLGWAIENICRNAADAIEGNGTISIKVYSNDKQTIIEVHDTGRGMSRSTARHIFDAGFTTKQRGWGIGLALTKRIVNEYHKGNISVAQTEVGVGTTIRIVI